MKKMIVMLQHTKFRQNKSPFACMRWAIVFDLILFVNLQNFAQRTDSGRHYYIIIIIGEV